MKLNNSIRNAFVLAAMQDVPTVDYTKQAYLLMLQVTVDAMPSSVARVYKDPKTKNYVKTAYIRYEDFGGYIPIQAALYDHEAAVFLGEATKELDMLCVLNKAQEERLKELKTKLRAVANGCTTRKQLLEALPDFEKYLPSVESSVTNLPVVSNVFGDFVKAGWPKDNPKLPKTA